MPRTRFNSAYYARITEWVKRAEAQTTAELVVAVEPRSGSYADADLLFGALLAYAVMILMFFLPFDFNELGVALNVPLFFMIGMQLCKHSPGLRRRLTTSKRRAAQARAAAEAAFQRCRVYQTRAHTGVLIYVSVLEREVQVLADSGVSAGMPNEEWAARVRALQAAATDADPAEALLKALEALGAALAQHMPAGADNPDELADEVRGTEA
ncbi:MAG: hypothetical protein HY291_11940 [Planctomycetes bacterium]|nr:hypothetical protein [Planctomycetota bacterium]